MRDIRLDLSNVSLVPTHYDMRLHATPEALAERLSAHLAENGEQLDVAIRHLRDDATATPSADLLKAAEEDPHSALADILEELLTGFGKPLPNLPADLAPRFDAMLKWHAARLADLDSALLG